MRKKIHSAPSEAPEPIAAEAVGFWTSESPEAAAYKKRFSEQISRLQERQMELVTQAAEELETLKREVEDSKELEEKIAAARTPLISEITNLQGAVQQLESHNNNLEEQLRIAQQGYQAQYNQLQSVLSALKNTMRTQAHSFDQQLRVFSLDATQSLESMLSTLENTQLPALEVPQTPQINSLPPIKLAPIPALAHTVAVPLPVADPQPERFRAHEEKLKRETIDKPKLAKATHRKPLLRRFAVRTIQVAVLGAVAFGSWHFLLEPKSSNPIVAVAPTATPASGQVAGASTDAGIVPPTTQYPESYVVLPYEQTQWAPLSDPVFGVSLQYPKNTSDKVRTIGGNDLWIIRNKPTSHYLMKISQDTSVSNLADWSAANGDFISQQYTITTGTFKNLPALVLTPTTQSATSGTEYVIKQGTFILTLWFENDDRTTDDGKRIDYMINSLQITKPTAS